MIETKPKTENADRALKKLHKKRARARQGASESSRGWRRLRYLIWFGLLLALVWAAEATWKRWLAIAGMILAAYLAFLLNPVEEEPRYGLDHEFAIESSEFLASIAGATNAPFIPGNRLDIYNNGDEFYPTMLTAIEQAQQTITIEAYIYWAGNIGRRFAEALAAKAKSGVSVKILLDAVGSSTISQEILETLENSGCQVRWYHPVRWYTINRVNNRTHRKSLIIDGRIGFTGGAGITDHWLGDAEDAEHWRDIQIRIEGPSVISLQTGFARNWLETTGELVSGDTYYPPPKQAGSLAVQSILSSPETGSSTVRIMYYLSIVCARKSIYIANPYFVPDEQAINILIDAKRRGVDVKIMVTGSHNDNFLARYNGTRIYGNLLAAGVEVYEYERTMLHQKYMVCDGIWSTVGTTNFDNRSFGLNDENNLCVFDRKLGVKWEQIFFDDLKSSRRIAVEDWRKRGVRMRVAEWIASLLRDQV